MFLKTRRAGINMGELFIGFILIIVGLSLQDTIQNTVDLAVVNASAMVASVLNLVPLIWVLVVCGVGIVLVYEQFREVK